MPRLLGNNRIGNLLAVWFVISAAHSLLQSVHLRRAHFRNMGKTSLERLHIAVHAGDMDGVFAGSRRYGDPEVIEAVG